MDWFGAAVTYVVVWWLVLFMVMPFGAQPPEPGMAPSAPARPRMGLKVLITSLIALVLTGAIMWVIETGLITLRPNA